MSSSYEMAFDDIAAHAAAMAAALTEDDFIVVFATFAKDLAQKDFARETAQSRKIVLFANGMLENLREKQLKRSHHVAVDIGGQNTCGLEPPAPFSASKTLTLLFHVLHGVMLHGVITGSGGAA
jgi:hypothetical protein